MRFGSPATWTFGIPDFRVPEDASVSPPNGDVSMGLAWKSRCNRSASRIGDKLTSWNAAGGETWILIGRQDAAKSRSTHIHLLWVGLSSPSSHLWRYRWSIRETSNSSQSAKRSGVAGFVKQIAKDVGDAVIIHIELMHPAALTATPGTFQLSVRNCIFDEIMAAIEVNDAGQIAARIAHRKRLRRRLKTAYRKMRAANDAEES